MAQEAELIFQLSDLDDRLNQLERVEVPEPGSVAPHAATHVRGGSDEIDGDVLDIDYTPSNYTPTTSPPEVTDVDELTAHLAGIDNALGATEDRVILVKTANYTILAADVSAGGWLTIVCNNTSAITITLLALASAYDGTGDLGAVVNVKRVNSGNVTVDGSGAETIDGNLTQSLGLFDNIQLQAGSLEWHII